MYDSLQQEQQNRSECLRVLGLLEDTKGRTVRSLPSGTVVNSRKQNKYIYMCIRQLSNGPAVPKQQPSGIWLVGMTCTRSCGQRKTMSPDGLGRVSLAASGLSCDTRDLTLQCVGLTPVVAH